MKKQINILSTGGHHGNQKLSLKFQGKQKSILFILVWPIIIISFNIAT